MRQYHPHPWSEGKQQIANDLRAQGDENDALYVEEDIGEFNTLSEWSQRGTDDHNTLREWFEELIWYLEGTKPTYEIAALMQTKWENFNLTSPYDPPQTRKYEWKYEDISRQRGETPVEPGKGDDRK